jgi:hypothetical protein
MVAALVTAWMSRRLDEAALEQTMSAIVQRLVSQPACPSTVAVDVTGLAPGAISTSS